MSLFGLLAEVLFVGHSLVGPTLPVLVDAGLAQMEQPARVNAQIINGAPLKFNWENSATAEGVDGRATLAVGGVTQLVLTEAIPLAAQIEWNDTAGQIAAFAGLAREANPETRVYLYETWHSLNSGPGAQIPDDPGGTVLWRERLTADRDTWRALAQGSGAEVIPAGQAMGRMADEITAGKVPGLQDIRDLFADDIHPNGKGLYLVAMVHLAVLTGKSPEGLPAKLTRLWTSRDAVISDDQAAVMQRIAWQTVQDFKALAPLPNPEPVPEPAPEPLLDPAKPGDQGSTGQTEAPATEAATLPDVTTPSLPKFASISNPNLAMGLTGVNDWSVQIPFLDVMKSARPWTGHLPGQWGGWDHEKLAQGGHLDAAGWIKSIPAEVTGISTLILTDFPADTGGVVGRYLMRWQGNGALRVEGSAKLVEEAPGRILFDFEPGAGPVILTLTETDRADPLRNLTVVREDRAAALDQGAIFNPEWLARIRGVTSIRLMDWMATNNSTLASADARPKPTDYTWARNGVPVEVMVALANELDADPWFTLPHLAGDDLVRLYAETAKAGLEPSLKAHVELSNEVWNWQFEQAAWAEAEGKARWGKGQAWVQFYALRAAQVADIWADVYGPEADARLVRVIGTQTGWKGLEEQILTAPLVMAEGLPAPADSFDAYAVTGYFSGGLGGEGKLPVIKSWLLESKAAAEDKARADGLTGAAAEAFIADHRFDLAVERAAAELRNGSVSGVPEDTLEMLLTDTFPYHAAIAARHGLRLMMYEGGTHVVGLGTVVEDEEITAFFNHLNYTPEMGVLYADLMSGWARVTDAPFNAFVDVYAPGKWGSWGGMRHLTDENPRWLALAKGCDPC